MHGIEVRLDITSYPRTSSWLWWDLERWLREDPELFVQIHIRPSSRTPEEVVLPGPEVISFEVMLPPGRPELVLALARALVRWMRAGHLRDITVGLRFSYQGKAAELRSLTSDAEIISILLSGRLDLPWDVRQFLHRAAEEASDSVMPVTIYLSDETIHEQVERAIEAHLAGAGMQIRARDDPIAGSWFRSMRASLKEAARSPAAREAVLTTAHAIDTRLVLAQDAAVTNALLQNLGPVLGALQPTKDAGNPGRSPADREGRLERARLPVDGRTAGHPGSSPPACSLAP